MFGFFKTKEQKRQDANTIIEEIHDAFYTEVDKLLADAKCMRPIETDKQDVIKKNHRLQSLGFTNAPEVKEAKKEQERLSEIYKENKVKREMAEIVEYFSHKYPLYKFITEESVIKICQKYNLIYAEVSRYTGTVPDKNLEQIEKFNIREEDECYFEQYSFGSSGRISSSNLISRDNYLRRIESQRERARAGSYSTNYIYKKAPLEICGPLKDFDTEGMELKNFKLSKIEIPDPIVLKPVLYKDKKHYLIVTAWGLEAADELVVNPVFN